jgi:hypothetical protein
MESRAPLAHRLPALLFPLLFLGPALPPFVDYPQHVAIAATLRRLADPASQASARYEANLLTYNGLFDELAALLSFVMPVERAARLLVVGALELFVLGAFALFARQRAHRLAYVLLVPMLPSFALVWGFTNHVLGMGLGFVFAAVLAHAVAKAERSPWRNAPLAALGLLLAHTHVLATILCLLVAGAFVLGEALRDDARPRAVAARVAHAALVVAPACAFCIFVHLRQVHTHASAYVVAAEGESDPLVAKLAWFGARVTGGLASHVDGHLVWAALAVGAAALAHRAFTRRTEAPGAHSSIAPVALPAFALVGAYLLVPSVFVGTFLVYPRLALPAAALLLGLVRAAPRAVLLEGAAFVVAAASFVVTGRALARFDAEARDLEAVLAKAPPALALTAVHETPRTPDFEPPVLQHVAAYHVARHDAHAAGLFGAYASLPVRFRAPEGGPRRSWLDGDGARFDPADPFAERFPARLVVLASPTDSLPAWAQRDHEERVRKGRFALVVAAGTLAP